MSVNHWYQVFDYGNKVIDRIESLCPEISETYQKYWGARKQGVINFNKGAPEHAIARTREDLQKGIANIERILRETDCCNRLADMYQIHLESGHALF